MRKTALVIFAYNRNDHIHKTLNSVIKNEMNFENTFIFIDGPKDREEDEKKVFEVTKTIENLVKDKPEIKIFRGIENKGLASSVIEGINYVFKNTDCEKVIVLEDDCNPDEVFFEYMNDSFDFYENFNKKSSRKVMHISGFGLPLKNHLLNKKNAINYLNTYPCSWGWGTWKKYWIDCNFVDNKYYNEILNDPNLEKKFNENGSAFSDFLKKQLSGEVNSWLIRWYAHLFKNNALSSWKVLSSIDNSGFDGSGNHKVKFDRFNQSKKYKEIFNAKIHREPIGFSEKISNPELNNEFNKYFINKSDKLKLSNITYFLYRKIRGI